MPQRSGPSSQRPPALRTPPPPPPSWAICKHARHRNFAESIVINRWALQWKINAVQAVMLLPHQTMAGGGRRRSALHAARRSAPLCTSRRQRSLIKSHLNRRAPFNTAVSRAHGDPNRWRQQSSAAPPPPLSPQSPQLISTNGGGAGGGGDGGGARARWSAPGRDQLTSVTSLL